MSLTEGRRRLSWSIKGVLSLFFVVLVGRIILSYTSPAKTYASYVKEVLQGDTVDKTAERIVNQVRGTSNEHVDYAGMKTSARK